MCGWIACDKVFINRKSILSHINCVHKKLDKVFQCEYQDCLYSAKTAFQMDLHRRNHIRNERLASLGIDSNGCTNATLREMIANNEVIEVDCEENNLIKSNINSIILLSNFKFFSSFPN